MTVTDLVCMYLVVQPLVLILVWFLAFTIANRRRK